MDLFKIKAHKGHLISTSDYYALTDKQFHYQYQKNFYIKR